MPLLRSAQETGPDDVDGVRRHQLTMLAALEGLR